MKKYNVTVNGTTYEVEVEEIGESASAPAPAAPKAAPTAPKAAPAAPKASAPTGASGRVKVTSPMPGTILNINVNVGQSVKKGETVCVLEAMKMENAIPAPEDGVVASVNVAKGASVNAGDVLVSLN